MLSVCELYVYVYVSQFVRLRANAVWWRTTKIDPHFNVITRHSTHTSRCWLPEKAFILTSFPTFPLSHTLVDLCPCCSVSGWVRRQVYIFHTSVSPAIAQRLKLILGISWEYLENRWTVWCNFKSYKWYFTIKFNGGNIIFKIKLKCS